MKKRFTALLLTLCMMAALSAAALADSAQYVMDDYGLLTDDEWSALEARAAALSEQYECGIYAIIVDDYSYYGSGSSEQVAERIYKDSGLGHINGDDTDGIVLLLSMDARDWALYAHGVTAESAFNKTAQSRLSERFLSDFGNDDWAGGVDSYITACGDFLQKLADYEANGGDLSDYEDYDEPGITVGVVIICALVSCLVALIVCLIMKGKMRSVRHGVEAGAYVSGGLNLTDGFDNYTHTTETRRRIERNNDSGGSSDSSASDGVSSSGKF
mgnify:FL=1